MGARPFHGLRRAVITGVGVVLVGGATIVLSASPAVAQGCQPGPSADLAGCDLAHAALAGAGLALADLRAADLTGADLYGANLTSARLDGATVSGADFGRATMFNSTSGALVGKPAALPPYWETVDGYVVGPGVDLEYTVLADDDLAGAHLKFAYLDGADLAGADLAGASLRAAYLDGADLAGADLDSADLRRAHLGGADLGGAVLSEADMLSALAHNAVIAGARFADTVCPDGTNSDAHGGTCAGHM